LVLQVLLKLDLEATKKVVQSAFKVHLKAAPLGKRAYEFDKGINDVIK
jgi:hypothetical protein